MQTAAVQRMARRVSTDRAEIVIAGAGQFVRQQTGTGRTRHLSVEGAKVFKAGVYPAPALQPVIEEALHGEQPFALRSVEEQRTAADQILRAALQKIDHAGFGSRFMAN